VGGDYSREAIILNNPTKGGRLFEGAINRGAAIIRGNTVCCKVCLLRLHE